ncbi:MAG: hypothetical protein AAF614_28135 [Chloroflexota bacterium]
MEKSSKSDNTYSFGSGRSWVNLVNNQTYLSDIELVKYIQDIWDRGGIGGLPNALLLPFLHEATHHRCFQSPVGFVLAVLELRARRKALSKIAKWTVDEPGNEVEFLAKFIDLIDQAFDYAEKDYTDIEIAEDVLRYEIAQTLLRPMAEGLALFAEFDIVSRLQSKVQSNVLTQATFMFTDNFLFTDNVLEGNIETLFDLLTLARPDVRFPKILYEARTSEIGVKRKADLYAQSFTSQNSDYLLGYLTVKDLWRHAMLKCRRLANETDLFYMFLHQYIYYDYELVAALLDSRTTEFESIIAINEHIVNRLEHFLQLDFESCIDQYEAFILRGAKDDDYPLQMMQTDMEYAQLGKRLFDNLLDDINNSGTHTSIQIGLDVKTLDQRDFLLLGSIEGSIQVEDSGKITLFRENTPVFSICTKEVVIPIVGEGAIEFHIAPRDPAQRFLSIWVGSELILTVVRGVNDEEGYFEDHHVKERVSSAKLKTVQNDLYHLGLQTFMEKSGFRLVIDHMLGQMPDVVRRIYANSALATITDDDKHERCQKVMHEHGLYKILNEDNALLQSLALLSNSCSVVPRKREIEKLFAENKLDLQATLSSLKKCTNQYGFPDVQQVEEFIVSYV